MSTPTYFPFFFNLSGKPILIVGGGRIATEKLESLLPTGASLTICSPRIDGNIKELVEAGRIQWIKREYDPEVLASFFMVIAATNDPFVNRNVFLDCENLQKPVNSVDDPDHCRFIFSANASEGPITVAISSSGESPALAQKIRKQILKTILTPSIGKMARFLGKNRGLLKRSSLTYAQKKRFWELVIESEIASQLELDSEVHAQESFNNALSWSVEHASCLECTNHCQLAQCCTEGKDRPRKAESAWSH